MRTSAGLVRFTTKYFLNVISSDIHESGHAAGNSTQAFLPRALNVPGLILEIGTREDCASQSILALSLFKLLNNSYCFTSFLLPTIFISIFVYN
jgi:hypothetical protein